MIHPHSNHTSCYFGDVSSMWRPKAAKLVHGFREHSCQDIVSMLKPCIMNNVGVKTICWCERHHKMCKLKTSTLHVAGSPCTDFSNLGKKQETEGKTTCDTSAWVGTVRQLEHVVVQLENVVSDALLQMIYGLLSDLYHCDKTVESPEFMGFPVRRVRMFIIFRHRYKMLAAAVPMANFTRRFHKVVMFTWHSYMVENELERKSELEWAFTRPSKKACQSVDDVWEALTIYKQDTVKVYREQVADHEQCAFSLNQNPACFRGRSSTSRILHTVVKNFGLVWSDASRRWMYPSNALLAQGFPIYRGVGCSASAANPDFASTSFHIAKDR